jgi:succinate-semialdehyde dehydrogenase / glutarate-semialdehyde dehydrogenase
MDPNTTLGPLCIKAALELVDKQIQMAVDGGAKVPMGGKRLDRRGYFLDPTILTDITPENPVFHVEFFAPVALVFRPAA